MSQWGQQRKNNMATTPEQIEGFLAGAQLTKDNYRAKFHPAIRREVLLASFGKVYAKIRCVSEGEKDGSVWAFIRLADGAIMKPDGATRPAKHARGNINTPTFGVEFVGPYGPAYMR